MSKCFQTFDWAIQSSSSSSVTLGGMEKFALFERLGLGLNLGHCSHKETGSYKEKGEGRAKCLLIWLYRMWLKLLDIVFSSYSWRSIFFIMGSCFIGFCFIFCQVSLSLSPCHNILGHQRYFFPYCHTQNCLDGTATGLHCLATVQIPPSILKLHSKWNILLKRQWHMMAPYPHFLTCLLQEFSAVASTGVVFEQWISCFHFLWVLSHFLQTTKPRWVGLLHCQQPFSPFQQHGCLYCSLNTVLQILANSTSVTLTLEACRILRIM